MTLVIYISGDGITPEMLAPLIEYLRNHGIRIIQIPLREETSEISSRELTASSYNSYIESFIPKSESHLVLVGESKGCFHLTRFASTSRMKDRVDKLILIEPTTMKPDLLVEFERQRGNDYIEDYAREPGVNENLDPTEKTIDEMVSDTRKYIPKCRTIIVWTTHDNTKNPYTPDVVHLKREYERFLRSNGCNLKVIHRVGNHCQDMEAKNYPFILRLLSE